LAKVYHGADFSSELLLHALHDGVLGSTLPRSDSVSVPVSDIGALYDGVLSRASPGNRQLHDSTAEPVGFLCEQALGFRAQRQVY
jgi:hypothetical protein